MSGSGSMGCLVRDSNLTVRESCARMVCPFIKAKWFPMQIRGPPPKGMKA